MCKLRLESTARTAGIRTPLCAVGDTDGCWKDWEADAAGGDSMFFDAIEHERSRQQSVSLLRDRAFRVRETTAEQQVQAQQAELLELRAILEADRQAAQATVSLLASERAAHAEALRRAAAEAEVKQAGAVRSKMAKLEAELREDAQQRQQLERHKADRAKREAAERHAHELEGLRQRVRELQAALVARDGEVEARMISVLERLDASEKALVKANSARSAAVLRAETADELAKARARETREAEVGLTAAQAELAQARAAAVEAKAAMGEAAEAPSPHPAMRAPRSRRGIATPAPSAATSTAMSMTAAPPASEPTPAPAAATPAEAGLGPARRPRRATRRHTPDANTLQARSTVTPVLVSPDEEQRRVGSESPVGGKRKLRRSTRGT